MLVILFHLQRRSIDAYANLHRNTEKKTYVKHSCKLIGQKVFELLNSDYKMCKIS